MPTTPPIMQCLECGYDLRGLDQPRCPECGRGFDPADRTTFGPVPPLVGRWGVYTFAYSVLFIALAPAAQRSPSILADLADEPIAWPFVLVGLLFAVAAWVRPVGADRIIGILATIAFASIGGTMIAYRAWLLWRF